MARRGGACRKICHLADAQGRLFEDHRLRMYDATTANRKTMRSSEPLPGSFQATLAVFGDPIVGRALVLLLRGYRYEARFMPASSSSSSIEMSGLLEDILLVLVTPTRSLS